jgi:predicted dehydrogenase
MADSKRLKWGILGTARIAQTLFIPGVRAGNLTEVVAVASRDESRAQAMAAELDIPRAHGSYERLLADPDVDAVYLPLPNSLHVEWTIAAARAGKHVLCEKPLAARAADAERMAHACQQAGVLLMEAFMWRHHPQHQRVRELIESGVIGEPNVVRSSFTYVINRHLPSGPNVRLASDLEGGSLMDIGCYAVNTARLFFGAEPVTVAGQQILDEASGVDAAFAGILEFPNERQALIDSSFRQYPANRYSVEGPDGVIWVEKAYRPDADPGRIHVLHGGAEEVQEVPPSDQFANEADHFARSVSAGRLLPPAEDGVAQARAIEALYVSAASGSAVALA